MLAACGGPFKSFAIPLLALRGPPMYCTDDRVPHKVVITEAAPAALAGANTGRSPRLKPHRHCRSGSVTQPARRPPRPNEHSSRPARAAHAPASGGRVADKRISRGSLHRLPSPHGSMAKGWH